MIRHRATGPRFNPVEYQMRELVLSRGLLTVISNEDYALASIFKWTAQPAAGDKFYAVRRGPRSIGAPTILLHRWLSGAAPGQYVDHVNGDTLDNRRENLRVCDQSQNMCNRGKQRNNKSGHKGVSWHKAMRKWHAQITFKGEHQNLGFFSNPEDAAAAYALAAKEVHGEFACV